MECFRPSNASRGWNNKCGRLGVHEGKRVRRNGELGDVYRVIQSVVIKLSTAGGAQGVITNSG